MVSSWETGGSNSGYASAYSNLTHCSLVTPYGDKYLSEHYLRLWLVAWRRQAVTWTNVDIAPARSSDNHLRAISLEIPLQSFTKISLKITCIKCPSNLPGASGLNDKSVLFQVQSFVDSRDDLGSGAQPLQQSLETIRSNIDWRERNQPDVRRWLEQNQKR